MRFERVQILGVAHRLGYAALVSALVWILVDLPSSRNLVYPYGPSTWLILLLDLPIAVATQVLPCKEFALDLWFTVEGGEACPQGFANNVPMREVFFNHMRVGIPVYVFLFYVPNIALGLARWWRRRRGAVRAA